MSLRSFMRTVSFTLVLSLAALPLAAQTKTWTPPKTPWGDPDIQGQWPATANIPMQRPASFGTRATLTDMASGIDEILERESVALTGRSRKGKRS